MSLRETCETEVLHTVGTPNHPVFSCAVFDKSEMLSWSGSLMGLASPSRSHLVGLLGLTTCEVEGCGQVATLLVTVVGSALAPRFLERETSNKNPGAADQSR